jgi:aminoacylase
MMNKLLGQREVERQRLASSPCLTLGEVMTVNLTMLEGGVLANVVPDQFKLTFDVRLPPSYSSTDFENQLRCRCRCAY